MKHCCVVVIGHVDHGKTALVRALTGIETDNLAEEKSRGLSIVPGFAHQSYDGGTIDFIDAPGHENFVQGMVSGATGAQAALIVISAIEGVRAQSLEHIAIAGLLGIETCVVAVTKSDMLSPTEQQESVAKIADALATSAFSGAPMILCSVLTGDGIDNLHRALNGLLTRRKENAPPLSSFLPIDRVFSISGRGTIVTGTLLGRALCINDEVSVQPSGRKTRIRGLQSRGKDRDSIEVGERMAANLRGVSVDEIKRGDVLCSAPDVGPTQCVDVQFHTLTTENSSLKHMENLRVMFGTTNAGVQIRLLGQGRLGPGQACFGQLRFDRPVVGFAGQRGIIRRPSPGQTIGGVTFLDPVAALAGMGDKRRLDVLQAAFSGDFRKIANALCAARGGTAKIADVARLSRMPQSDIIGRVGKTHDVLAADFIVSRDAIVTCKNEMVQSLSIYHSDHPLKVFAPRSVIRSPGWSPELSEHVEAMLEAAGEIDCHNDGMMLRAHDPAANLNPDQNRRIAEIEDAYREADLALPLPPEAFLRAVDQDLIDLLIHMGRLITLRNVALGQTLILHTDQIANAAALLGSVFTPSRPFKTGEARDALNTTRRVIVPLLEHFDSKSLTIRDGDTRRFVIPNSVSQEVADC